MNSSSDMPRHGPWAFDCHHVLRASSCRDKGSATTEGAGTEDRQAGLRSINAERSSSRFGQCQRRTLADAANRGRIPLLDGSSTSGRTRRVSWYPLLASQSVDG